MAGRVAVVVLLVVVFVSALGLASTRDSVKPDVVVVEDGNERIYEEIKRQPQKVMSTSLIVKPGDDFKAVCVGAGYVHILEWRCFGFENCKLSNTTWNLMKVEVKVMEVVPSTRFKLEYKVKVNCCVDTRYETFGSENITHMDVHALGASKWLLNGPPDTCPDTTTENPSSGPPSTPDTTTENPSSLPPSTPVLPVVMAVLVWVAAAAAVAVTVVTKRALAARNSVKVHSVDRRGAGRRDAVQVTENSLYEPLPGPVTPAATQEP